MSRLADLTYSRLPAYLRAADGGFMRRWFGAIADRAETVVDVVDRIDPLSNPSGPVSCVSHPTTAPAVLLPWMAWMAGLFPDYADLPPDLLREVLARPPQWRRRGSSKAMEASVAATLTGTQTVEIENHVGGDMWHMRVLVVEGEMPDRAATEAAAMREKPAGVKTLEVLATATPHAHTIGQLAGRAGGHPHTIGQLAGRSTGHGHTIGQLAGRP